MRAGGSKHPYALSGIFFRARRFRALRHRSLSRWRRQLPRGDMLSDRRWRRGRGDSLGCLRSAFMHGEQHRCRAASSFSTAISALAATSLRNRPLPSRI
jgi:hypothetical protein